MHTIGTHSGSFHCDEALACALLKKLPKFANSPVIRTRDSALLEKQTIVVDVGGVFDRSKLRFDHHQRSFNESFDEESAIKLSSAGLIYKYYGKEILRQVLQVNDDTIIELIYKKLYEDFIKPIDAIDNGINQYNTAESPRYTISTDLSSRVGHLNCSWQVRENYEQISNAQFQKAMALTIGEFIDAANYIKDEWIPARIIIQKAFNDSLKNSHSEKVLVLDSYVPFKSHIFDMEGTEKVLYVVYQSDTEPKQWRINAVPVEKGSFVSRKALPCEWRGLRGKELDKASGISGCVFVHATGFTGGNESYEGVMEMAKKSIEK